MKFFVKGNEIYKRFSGEATIEKTCGYCHSRKHSGRLSPKLVKEHGCLEKQCPFLEKYDHPWWTQVEKKKHKEHKDANSRTVV